VLVFRLLVLLPLGLIASPQRPLVHELFGPDLLISWVGGQKAHEEVMGLFYAGNYALALQNLDQAIADAKRLSKAKEKDAAILLTTKAQWLSFMGDTRAADEAFVQAESLAKQVLSTNHPAMARIQLIRAEVLLLRDNVPEAKLALERVITARAAFHKAQEVVHAMVLRLQAMVLLPQGETTQARTLLSQSSRLIERTAGPQSLLYGGNMWLESLVAAATGEYEKAIRLCESSLAVLTNCYGPEHLVLTHVRTSLATWYQQAGMYEKALPLLQDNLRTLELTLGPSSAVGAITMNALGLLQYRLGNYPDAEKSFRRCLSIREISVGVDSFGYAIAVNNLALVLLERGKRVEAAELFRDAAIVVGRALGQDSPQLATALCNGAFVLESYGLLDKAKLLYEEALRIRRKAFGEHHPATAESLSHCASLQLKLGNTDYARELATQGLAIRQEFFRAEHPAIADSLDLLASSHVATGDYQQAVALFSQSATIRLHSQGDSHPSLGITLENAALACQAIGEYPLALKSLMLTFPARRFLLTTQFGKAGDAEILEAAERSAYRMDLFQSLLSVAPHTSETGVAWRGAEQLALNKAVVEELQVVRAALEASENTTTRHLQAEYLFVQTRLALLSTNEQGLVERDAQRRALQSQLADIEAKLASKLALVEHRIQDSRVTILDVASALPPKSCLLDFVEFERYDFGSKSNRWQGKQYAVCLTFPVPHGSTNLVLERVDLGDAAPVNEAVEFICKRMSSGAGYARDDVTAALQRLGDLVYAPLAKYLTNVSHLIICPDGQLSRVPFEMLRVGGRFLIEEKTISYVTSGREIARLQSRSGGSPDPGLPGATTNAAGQAGRLSYVGAALVMGGPDFDLDLAKTGSSRREEALAQKAATNHPQSEPGQSLLASAATRTLSRDYRGGKFPPLPGAEAEARGVAQMLGKDCVLRLGAEAREAELKAVQSPRVLHLATHGFYLSDQELRQTNSLPFGRPGDWGQAGRLPYVQNDRENPLVRCGIALAGANHAGRITNAVAEDGVLTGLEAALLNLQGTELVILSACDSGTGEVKIGEGVMSLRRAFRIAGAQTVLASHWNVSDKATSQLMTEFMRRWRAGEPRGKAWREAQLSLLRSKEFSNAYFWAAFTLTGQWN
jgi:CHAT domain-containing protein